MRKEILKKSICLLLAGVMVVAMGGCAFVPPTSSASSGNNSSTTKPVKPSKPEDTLSALGNPLFDGVSSAPYTTEDYTFTTIFTDGETKEMPQYDAENIADNEFVTYEINSNIKDKNYLKLSIETDVDLVGYINYENNDENNGENNTENENNGENNTENENNGENNTENNGENNTENNGENNTNTEKPDEKGCGGVLSIGAVASMILAGAWVTIAARKN